MPVTTPPSENRLTPKSVLRHRPIASERQYQEVPAIPRASRTTRRQLLQPASTSSRLHTTVSSADVPTWKVAGHAPRSWPSRLLPGIGVGIVLAVLLIVLAQMLLGWVGNTWNTMKYSYPRTYQVDAVVGHDDSTRHPSHFIALNLHDQVEILEFPGGDVAHVRVYVGPQLSGPQADLLPVTLRFVTPPHAHLPNMIVLVGGSQFVFVNTHGTFASPVATHP